MAHATRKLCSIASIADLVEDLKLLGVSASGYRTADEVQGARDQRIEKLKEVNGTLDKVCFTAHFFLNVIKKRDVDETPCMGHKFNS